MMMVTMTLLSIIHVISVTLNTSLFNLYRHHETPYSLNSRVIDY